MTSGRRFIPEVDGLRFVAISAVVLFHLGVYTSTQHMSAAQMHPTDLTVQRFLQLGAFGVQLFFLLSGFVLALPFAKWRLGIDVRPSLRRYYLRRLTRLEPPYLFALCAIFFTGVFLHGSGLQAQEWPAIAHWPNLLASLFYQHNLIYGRGSRILTAAWSLEIEAQFYLLAPLLAVVFSIPHKWVRRSLLLLAIFAVPGSRALLSTAAFSVPSLLIYIEWFLAGFLLADFYLVDWEESPSRSHSWDVLNLMAWGALLCVFASARWSALAPPLALIAYAGVFRSRLANWLITVRPVTTIGGMCYSIYLLHWHVISAVGFFARRTTLGSGFVSRFSIDGLVILPVVLMVSTVFFMLIERPCMDPAWAAKLTLKFRRSPLFQPPTCPTQSRSQAHPAE